MNTYDRLLSGLKPGMDILLSRIVSTVQPKMIFCFGIRMAQRPGWSCFPTAGDVAMRNCLDLLVIVNGEGRARHEMTDAVERLLREEGYGGAVLVHSWRAAGAEYAIGNYFFTRVFSSGILLYNDGAEGICGWADSAVVETRAMSSAEAGRHYSLATEFLQGARYFHLAGVERMAAFMLHQATEHTCSALIRKVSGYRMRTHNLCRLLSMTDNFWGLASRLFPCNTSRERTLFTTLSAAYSDVRYRGSYAVMSSVAAALLTRISYFHERAGLFLKTIGETFEKNTLTPNLQNAYEG